jgi:hypothetical protein
VLGAPRATPRATTTATSCSSRWRFTGGGLYPLLDGKDDLALASVDWVPATWDREVAEAVEEEPDPAAALC